MYIRKTKNAQGQSYYHLVESYRANRKVKQRILMSLGRVEDNRISKVAEAIQKFTDQVYAIDLAKEIDVKQTYILGPLLILDAVMERWGINKIIDKISAKHSKLSYDFRKTIFTLILSRFIQPVSKLSLYDNWLKKLYPEKIDSDVQLHQIYRSLDLLAVEKETIEKFLYQYQRDLFSISVDVVLYDLTTLRFESTRIDLDTLRRFGYSKEKRSDCTQIVLGLLTDAEGIPLCFEAYPGNTFEGNTLEGIVSKMREKFQVRRFIFVADRGLFSEDNLGHLRKEKGEFIVGLRLGKKEKQIEGLYDINRYTWLGENMAVRETTLDGDRVILTWSAVRAERDRKTREDILDKIRKKLSSKKSKVKSFVTNENYKKYIVLEGKLPVLNVKAIEEESRKDGFFAVITNVKEMSSAEIVLQYKHLWRIEDAFGEIKGTFKTRPVFHWTNNRIIGHLIICFLCYFCQSLLTRELRKRQEQLKSKATEKKIIQSRSLTVPMAFSELSSVLAIPVSVGTKKIWVRTDIGENAQKLFKALNIKIPPKIIKIEQ